MARSLVYKESVMSHCWPRSHSPVGSNVVFFKPRALPHQARLLSGGLPCLSLLSCVLYRNVYNTSRYALELIEVEGSVVKPKSQH